MRGFVVLALCLAGLDAGAQTDGPETDTSQVGASQGDASSVDQRGRAPLLLQGDLSPAVDVGAPAPAAAPVAPTPSAAAPAGPAAAGRRSATLDSLDLGTTSITGNQELPKVLYIVPWKRSDLGDVAGRPVNTLLDEVLSPIDPEVFERQLDYFDSLYGTTAKE